MKPIYGYKVVTLNINANTGAAEVAFNDQPELVGKRVVGIEVFDETQMTYTVEGIPVISAATSLFASLTFKDQTSLERLKDVPLWTLNPVYMAGIYKQFEPFLPNWQSCFAKFAQTPPATQFQIPVGIMYEN